MSNLAPAINISELFVLQENDGIQTPKEEDITNSVKDIHTHMLVKHFGNQGKFQMAPSNQNEGRVNFSR